MTTPEPPAAPPPPPPSLQPVVPAPVRPASPPMPAPMPAPSGAGGRGGSGRTIAIVGGVLALVLAVGVGGLLLARGGAVTTTTPTPPAAGVTAAPSSVAVAPSAPGGSPSAAAATPSPRPPATPSPVPTATPAPTPSGDPVIRIGISLPLSGGVGYAAAPARDGALLALQDVAIPGYRVEALVLDHAVNGVHDPQQGANDMMALAADPSVVAVVGPFNSSVAKLQIPISNAAGLLQCSPANTNPDLTGQLAWSSLHPVPDRTTYVRVATPDDQQGTALASFARRALGARKAGVVDDGESYGTGLADGFAAAWTAAGGTVLDRVTVTPDTNLGTTLKRLRKAHVDVVMFGGLTSTGGTRLRFEMAALGMQDVPLVSGDGIMDGGGDAEGSYIALTGEAAVNTYSSVAAITEFEGQDAFATHYRAIYGDWPGAYSAPAYACTQVILEAIRTAAASDAVTREAVRAAATDPATTVETVLGPVRFNAAGDVTHTTVSIYRVDTRDDGYRDWTYVRQVERDLE